MRGQFRRQKVSASSNVRGTLHKRTHKKLSLHCRMSHLNPIHILKPSFQCYLDVYASFPNRLPYSGFSTEVLHTTFISSYCIVIFGFFSDSVWCKITYYKAPRYQVLFTILFLLSLSHIFFSADCFGCIHLCQNRTKQEVELKFYIYIYLIYHMTFCNKNIKITNSGSCTIRSAF